MKTSWRVFLPIVGYSSFYILLRKLEGIIMPVLLPLSGFEKIDIFRFIRIAIDLKLNELCYRDDLLWALFELFSQAAFAYFRIELDPVLCRRSMFALMQWVLLDFPGNRKNGVISASWFGSQPSSLPNNARSIHDLALHITIYIHIDTCVYVTFLANEYIWSRSIKKFEPLKRANFFFFQPRPYRRDGDRQ